MDTDSIISAFYDTPPPVPEEDKSLLGGGKIDEKPSAEEESPGASPEPAESTVDIADVLYGPGESQVPEGGHYPEAEDLYGQLENEDRINGEEVDSQAFHDSRTALQQFAADAGLGRPHMQTLMDAARQAIDYPISSIESLEAQNERCLSELRSAWGGKFDENLAFAKAEADRLTSSVPTAYEVLNMGAGSNPALVKIMADAGRARARRK